MHPAFPFGGSAVSAGGILGVAGDELPDLPGRSPAGLHRRPGSGCAAVDPAAGQVAEAADPGILAGIFPVFLLFDPSFEKFF